MNSSLHSSAFPVLTALYQKVSGGLSRAHELGKAFSIFNSQGLKKFCKFLCWHHFYLKECIYYNYIVCKSIYLFYNYIY